MSVERGDLIRFARVTLDGLVGIGGGFVGEGVIVITRPDVEAEDAEGEVWVDLPAGSYRVIEIEREGTLLTFYEG